MHYSLWTYPWDLLDIGIEEAMAEIAATGLTGVSLTTSYHAGRFLQPRSPKRKVYFPEDGTLYFPFREANYRSLRIRPAAASLIRETPDFWDRAFEAAEKHGLDISGWTVCLHNTKLGMEYPDTTVKNAYGDAYYYNLCPSNEDVRLYMTTMLADLARYPFRALELESLNFMGFPHEFHHEKDGVGLTVKDEFLLSLCFCDSCKKRASRDGLDIAGAQRIVRGWLDELCERELPISDDERFMREGIGYFEDYPDVADYLRWRVTVVTSLAGDLKAVVPERTRLYFLSLLTPDSSWLFGVDFEAIAKVNDGIVVCCYDTGAEPVGTQMALSRRHAHGTELFTGLRVFYPEVRGKQELIDKVTAARRAGTDGYVFYNYGLIPRKRMDWIREAIDTVKSDND